jgi:hypothetical protein
MAVRGFWRFPAVSVVCATMSVAPAQADAWLVGKAPAPQMPVAAPAVDGLNGKLDLFGGSLARNGYYGGTGTLSIPVGHQSGVQFDGLAGSYRNAFVGAMAVHLFKRDPARGLIGLYADYNYWNRLGGSQVGHFGLEGAIYVGRATLEGVVGVETGNNRSDTIGGVIETIDFKTRFFDRIDISYYPVDNLKLSIGHRYLGGKHMLALGGEWGIDASQGRMVALFAEARLAGSGRDSYWGGVKVYFGQKPKPLILRHRQDDPINGLKDNVSAFTNAGSQSSAGNGKSQAQLDCEAGGDRWVEGVGCVSGPL